MLRAHVLVAVNGPRLDAVVTLTFMVITVLVLLSSAREWVLILTRRKPAKVQESPFVETAYAG